MSHWKGGLKHILLPPFKTFNRELGVLNDKLSLNSAKLDAIPELISTIEWNADSTGEIITDADQKFDLIVEHLLRQVKKWQRV